MAHAVRPARVPHGSVARHSYRFGTVGTDLIVIPGSPATLRTRALNRASSHFAVAIALVLMASLKLLAVGGFGIAVVLGDIIQPSTVGP